MIRTKYKVLKLEDIAVNSKNAIVDGPFGSALKVKDYVDDGIPVLQGKNISNFQFNFSDIRYITPQKAQELIRSKVEVGDILFVKIGSIGYSAEVTDLNGYPFAIIPANLAKVSIDYSKVDKNYLLFWLRSDTVVNYLKKNASKTAQPALSLGKIKQIPVVMPSLETQKKISAVLLKAQELIDKRKAQIEALDQLTQSVFLEMFGDPLLNPKGWKKESFSYFAKIDTVMIKDFTEYGELIHVGIENIEKDSGRIVNCRTVAEDKIVSGKYLFNEKHIIYSKIRPYLNKVATPNFKGVCSADAYPILVDETKASRHFFAFLLRSKAFLNHVNQHSDRTNIPKVNKNQLLSFEGICPPLELQNKFSKVVEKIEEQRELLIQGLHELEKNFNSLMQRAFKGELFND
ncbi:restriction endonuclease subunit S [Geobacillus stearothermophilus]|uniref:restriction endonuclease subunit S n=1 Tax=Geobacillus stearothermophilus TaxID=1422 RepID=UPI003D1DBFF0